VVLLTRQLKHVGKEFPMFALEVLPSSPRTNGVAHGQLRRSIDEEARGREVRRLRAEVQRLEEEKQDLMRRLAFVERELEKARAKIPPGISTS